MVHKYVEDKVNTTINSQMPMSEEEERLLREKHQFDTITKLEGSLNVKVQQRQQEEEKKRRLKQEQKKKNGQSLHQMENNVEKLLYEEALVVLGQEVLEKIRAIYQQVLEE